MKALKIITTLTIGLTAGLVAGYLTAPSSGKKTRKKISGEIDSQFKSLENSLNDKISKIKNGYIKQVDNLADNSKDTLKKAKEMVSIN
jgi:gas vesicle protein